MLSSVLLQKHQIILFICFLIENLSTNKYASKKSSHFFSFSKLQLSTLIVKLTVWYSLYSYFGKINIAKCRWCNQISFSNKMKLHKTIRLMIFLLIKIFSLLIFEICKWNEWNVNFRSELNWTWIDENNSALECIIHLYHLIIS